MQNQQMGLARHFFFARTTTMVHQGLPLPLANPDTTGPLPPLCQDSLYGDFGGSTADPPPVPAQVAPFCEPLPSRAAIESDVINPCAGIGGNYSALPMLTSLSCLATRAGVVLVASAADAGGDGSTCYNTQLAFDANGRLLAKYHKQHLFAEPQFTAGNTTVDNMVVFDGGWLVVRGGCVHPP